MDRFLHEIGMLFPRRPSLRALALSWLSGLAAGIWVSFQADDSFFTAMRAAAEGRVSIIGLMSAILLPLLFSAFAVYVSQLWLLVPAAFLKAFSFSCLAFGVTLTFGSAGWLVRGLLMFSDCLTLPLLWWFWFRCIRASGQDVLRSFLVACTAALVIGCLDYGAVSPLLANLIL